ncbi:hypothetical protein ACHAXS_008387 [Conticribra weissflogii]
MRSIIVILLSITSIAHRTEAGKSFKSENYAQSERPRPYKNLRGAKESSDDRELEQATAEFYIESKNVVESIEMEEEIINVGGERDLVEGEEATRQRREEGQTAAEDEFDPADDEDRDLLDISDFMSKTSPNIPLPAIDWEDLIMPLPTHDEET